MDSDEISWLKSIWIFPSHAKVQISLMKMDEKKTHIDKEFEDQSYSKPKVIGCYYVHFFCVFIIVAFIIIIKTKYR